MTALQPFRHLLNFGGRDPRGVFWPYAAVVFGLYMVVGMSALFLVIALAVSAPTTSEAASIGPAFVVTFLATSIGVFVAMILLLAAAIARRLHDSGLSALWGLLPLPFVAISVSLMYTLFMGFGGGEVVLPPAFIGAFFSNIGYMAALITLIVLLCRRSTAGPNRYGEPPATPIS